ncbi:FAD-dependent oxidoreductase [Silicimonas algicola]|nr:FAD-dependent oxidoreductase [Silicimonas algicola]
MRKDMQETLKQHYDLVVFGAGPGGLSAAIVAARRGLRVALVERSAMVAGTVNVGLCLHGFQDDHGNRVVGGVSWELIQRCIDEGGSTGPTHLQNAHMYSTTPVDMAVLQKCALDMLEEAGVECWFHTLATEPIVEGRRLASVKAWSNSGEIEFIARSFVDATGHADIAFRAGVPVRSGRFGDGAMQPMTLGLSMAPVDITRMMEAIGEGFGMAVKPGMDAEDYVWFALNFTPWREQVEKIGIRLGDKGTCWGNSIYPKIVNLNAVKIIGMNGADARELSRAEVASRRIAVEFAKFMRENIPGFEEAYITRTSPYIGIRETRHIDGVYTLSDEDAIEGHIPDDSIALCGYPIDIHDPIDGAARFQRVGGGRFGISFKSLVPTTLDNLLVSGRGISASDQAFGSVRVMGTCLAIGEACGYAAAMSKDTNANIGEMDGVVVRSALEDAGVMMV